jgi:cystathionine beta-synthase
MRRAWPSEIPGAWFADQFNNPANPLAHETTTGPGDLGADGRHEVDAIVVGVGSSGTLTGLSRYFARVQPDLEFVLADPVGSILAEYVRTGTCPRCRVRGPSKASARTSSFHRRPVARAPRLFDQRRGKLRTRAPAAAQEGMLAGSSTGTLLAAACATAASRPSRSAWSPSSATPARAT